MKTKKYLFVILIIFIKGVELISAQIIPEWSDTTFANLQPAYTSQFKMKTDKYGNVYTSGYKTDTVGFYKTNITKYNTNGIKQWSAIIDSSHYNTRLAIDSSGNVYVCGARYTLPAGLHLTKYDASGTLIWDQIFNQTNWLHDIVIDDSNYVILASQVNLSNFYHFVTLKIDWNGDLMWSRKDSVVNGNSWAYLTTDRECNVYFAGRSWYSTTQHSNIYKYNYAGVKKWETTYSGNYPGGGSSPSGLIYKNGYLYMLVNSYVFTPVNMNNVGVVKYDTAGNFIWEGVYDGPYNGPLVGDFDVDNWDNTYVTGSNYNWSSPDDSIVTIRFDSSGSIKWVNSYSLGFSGSDRGHDIIVDSLGYIYVTGQISTPPSSVSDFITFKYDSAGNELWNTRFNGFPGSNEEAYAICTDPLGNIYVSGNIMDGNISSILTLKYSFYTGLETESDLNSRLSVYPNPFIDKIELRSTIDFKHADFCLFDLTGRKVFEQKCIQSKDVTIPRSNVVAGMYIYNLKMKHQLFSGKLIAK